MMGLEEISDPTAPLTTVVEMWGHVLFWSFLLTTLTYVSVGVLCAVCLRLFRKGVSCLVPLGYLAYGELSVLTMDAIASAFVAGIYSTSGWTMASGVALGWGLGISLFTILLNILISCAPLYTFL